MSAWTIAAIVAGMMIVFVAGVFVGISYLIGIMEGKK